MDRRSWLWRRKSSDKSPGETESSGSISSHSERFSDEQGYPMQNAQSVEVTSKSAVLDEEIGENENSLSAALRNIRAKEELVKQHAKVAEEAVSGWEKAENEVSALKKQLEEATHENESLVTRVGYLDGALKECVRQLRQAKEEQEAKITEAISKRSLNWESSKSELERENSTLKSELQARFEELEMMAMDRDLSIRAAECASKQHLESINRVRKLEAECLRLKAAARKALASSVGAESFSDSQSDFGERNESVKSEVGSFRTLGRSRVVASSVGFNLMDDFLEMEKLAAGPDKSVAIENESSMKSELQAMINRTAELEEDIGRRETEKAELAVALRRCRFELDASEKRLKEAEEKLNAANERSITRAAELEKEIDKKKAEKLELSTALRQSREKLRAATAEKEKNEAENAELSGSLRRCQEQLSKSLTRLKEAEEKLRAANASMEATESQTKEMDSEMKALLNKVKSLEEDMERDRALLDRRTEKCRVLEDEISKMKKKEADLPRASELHRAKLKQDQELAVAASRFAECQKTIASLGHKLKSLASLEDFLAESDKMSESEIPEYHRNDVEAKPKADIGGFYVQKRTGVVDESSTLAKNNLVEKNQHGSRRFPSRAKDRRVN